MTADDFRRIALSMPDAVESAHMNHPDFRVGKRIFATLGWPDEAWAMVKLTPEEQQAVVGAHPRVFTPVSGGWGRGGSTNVRLAVADEATVRPALELAWHGRIAKAAERPRRGGKRR